MQYWGITLSLEELFKSTFIESWWDILRVLQTKLVYLNGNNAAEGESNIKYANSYPMKWTVKNWFAQDIFELLW